MSAVKLRKMETSTIPLNANETEMYERAVNSYDFLKVKRHRRSPRSTSAEYHRQIFFFTT